MIDNLLLSVPISAGFWYYLTKADSIAQLVANLISFLAFILIPMIFVSIIYHFVFLQKTGATIGKQIAGVKIIDQTGNLLSRNYAFFRENIAKTVSGSILGLGYYAMLKSDTKQTWHDRLVGSIAINTGGSLLGTVAVIIILLILNTYLLVGGIKAMVTNRNIDAEFIQLQKDYNESSQEATPSVKLSSPSASPMFYRSVTPSSSLTPVKIHKTNPLISS